MEENEFHKKWKQINDKNINADEYSLYVEKDKEPITQRQINLYYYFLFISDIVKKNNLKNILEIGCGRGTMSLFLKEYLDVNVSLLDNTDEATNLAKQIFESRGLDANYYVDNALNTSLAGNQFDMVVSIGLAEHIDDTKKLLAEQYRLLKSGGVMVSLNIPNKVSIQYLNKIMRLFKKIFGGYKTDIKKDYYRNNLGPKEYKKIASNVGFENISTTNVCPFPIYTPVSIETDKKIAKINNFILKIRKIFQKYPYKTNYMISQAHFLVGYKK